MPWSIPRCQLQARPALAQIGRYSNPTALSDLPTVPQMGTPSSTPGRYLPALYPGQGANAAAWIRAPVPWYDGKASYDRPSTGRVSVAFCRLLCYAVSRKESSFSASRNGRQCSPLDGGRFLPPDLRKGGLSNECVGSIRALSLDTPHG